MKNSRRFKQIKLYPDAITSEIPRYLTIIGHRILHYARGLIRDWEKHGAIGLDRVKLRLHRWIISTNRSAGKEHCAPPVRADSERVYVDLVPYQNSIQTLPQPV